MLLAERTSRAGVLVAGSGSGEFGAAALSVVADTVVCCSLRLRVFLVFADLLEAIRSTRRGIGIDDLLRHTRLGEMIVHARFQAFLA